jgi:hypothetical protein
LSNQANAVTAHWALCCALLLQTCSWLCMTCLTPVRFNCISLVVKYRWRSTQTTASATYALCALSTAVRQYGRPRNGTCACSQFSDEYVLKHCATALHSACFHSLHCRHQWLLVVNGSTLSAIAHCFEKQRLLARAAHWSMHVAAE